MKAFQLAALKDKDNARVSAAFTAAVAAAAENGVDGAGVGRSALVGYMTEQLGKIEAAQVNKTEKRMHFFFIATENVKGKCS